MLEQFCVVQLFCAPYDRMTVMLQVTLLFAITIVSFPQPLSLVGTYRASYFAGEKCYS